jgi:hypothetical protein
VVDILEQVCAAVHEAHQQGVIHRDLKPDNIWLEPNGLGGYRVKVLDFGIAKLAEAGNISPEISPVSQSTDNTPTIHFSQAPVAATAAAGAGELEPTRIAVALPSNLESDTLIQPAGHGPANVPVTQASPNDVRATQAAEESDQTRILDGKLKRTSAAAVAGHQTDAMSTAATTGLTRVGAILGTPLYMSPEQCRGESLDARSDIYSLGVIAYQMLAGATPFTGDTTSVIRAHTENQPTVLREHNRKLPKRVSRLIMSALEKDRVARPQTAAAFANAMRANADGLGTLYRRAFSLYSEYFPEFFKLSLLAHIPMIIVTAMWVTVRVLEGRMTRLTTVLVTVPLSLLTLAAQFVTGSMISGVTAVIVTQLAVAPMKPVRLRAAINVLRRRWRPFLSTGIRVIIRIVLGWLLVIPGLVMTIRYMLWGPVVLLEGLEKKAAIKRAVSLGRRSWWTLIKVMLIQLIVPAIVGSIIGALSGLNTATTHGKATVSVKVTSQLAGLVNIFVLPLLAIVPALLYLKMRQLGGETINELMDQIEAEGPTGEWQKRMRSRLAVTPQNRTPSGRRDTDKGP